MKIYFDTLDPYISNLNHLTSSPTNPFYVVSPGSIIKKCLTEMGYSLDLIDQIDSPGCYFIDVNGDPSWWSGVGKFPGVHILNLLPKHIIRLVRNRKLRLIIGADKEGGEMINKRFDCFKNTLDAMINNNLPKGSVLIIQGNKKIKTQYDNWLTLTGNDQLFEVQYSCHFDKIFFNQYMPSEPIVLTSINNATKDFNSLNRVYRSHRGAHCVFLVKHNLLSQGLVSCNSVNPQDYYAPLWNNISPVEFQQIMKDIFPLFLDGNWADTNAANQYNLDIYKNSLLSFITETKFDEDVVFLTEKIFKPLALGHPLILLASAGTLKGLRELGFRTDWCGIDPEYNDIIDDKERFIKTNEVLKDWVLLPREEKIKKINQSMETINHNFKLIRNENFYFQSLTTALTNSRKYFNE
jgi:hypothetical protein